VEQADKELVSAHAAWLCRAAGFDAAIVTKEGAGNADNDLMLKIDALEADGLTAVALYAELSGADGTGPPLVAGCCPWTQPARWNVKARSDGCTTSSWSPWETAPRWPPRAVSAWSGPLNCAKPVCRRRS
jgi:hypothetical protein